MSAGVAIDSFGTDRMRLAQVTIANISYCVWDNGAEFEYRMAIRTSIQYKLSKLARYLRAHPCNKAFHISQSSD